MAPLKYLTVLCLVALASAAPAAKNITLGQREPGDSLVETKYFSVKPNPDKRNIFFRSFDVANDKTITQVVATDMSSGTGGYATFEYGGPGMNRVLIGFHSEINQGINYQIELYAKPYVKP